MKKITLEDPIYSQDTSGEDDFTIGGGPADFQRYYEGCGH